MDNYTNRISCSEYCELLKKTGFEIVGLNKRKYKKAPIKRSKLDAAFKDMSEDDLLTSNAIIVTRKK